MREALMEIETVNHLQGINLVAMVNNPPGMVKNKGENGADPDPPMQVHLNVKEDNFILMINVKMS